MQGEGRFLFFRSGINGGSVEVTYQQIDLTTLKKYMYIKKSYQINQLRDYSSLFSRSEVLRWNKNDLTSLITKISRYDNSLINKKYTYLSYLKYVYKVLEKFYPNEYIYKNEFINKWLIRELGKSDSIVYNEFRLGKTVADI